MSRSRDEEMYWAGYRDGYRRCFIGESPEVSIPPIHHTQQTEISAHAKHALMGREKSFGGAFPNKPKRKLSAWQKFVKANSKKPRFRYKSGAKKGKLNLKAMGAAYRKKKR